MRQFLIGLLHSVITLGVDLVLITDHFIFHVSNMTFPAITFGILMCSMLNTF